MLRIIIFFDSLDPALNKRFKKEVDFGSFVNQLHLLQKCNE